MGRLLPRGNQRVFCCLHAKSRGAADLLFVQLTARRNFSRRCQSSTVSSPRGERDSVCSVRCRRCRYRLDSRRRRAQSQDCFYMFNEMLPTVSGVIQ